ncbi:MAG: hypothetical protein K6E16_07920 [Lachnospiraceae bacterium]|nr:hypothetical protein [Lachnospiraceae bacterium]
MKKRVFALLLSIALVLTFTACGKSAEADDGQQEITEEQTEDDSDDKQDQEAAAPAADEAEKADASKAEAQAAAEPATDDGAEEDNPMWKQLYVRLLDKFREDLPAYGSDEPANEWTPIEYYLYDIDKDGIPEMIVKYGTCEADYHGELYKNDGYAVRPIIFDLVLGHTSFYTDPDGGIISVWGHMGSQSIVREKLVKDQLESEDLFSETLTDSDSDYTEVSTVVPGSVYISPSTMYMNIAVTRYEELMDRMAGQFPSAAHDDAHDKELSDAVENTIDGDGAVVSVNGDGFGPELGTVPFSEMLKKLDQWGDEPFEIESKEYADVNGDGKNDCVIWLKQNKDNYTRRNLCVLNLQDGKMYAYNINYLEGYELKDQGKFTYTGEYGSYSFGLIFDHDECMKFYVED